MAGCSALGKVEKQIYRERERDAYSRAVGCPRSPQYHSSQLRHTHTQTSLIGCWSMKQDTHAVGGMRGFMLVCED